MNSQSAVDTNALTLTQGMAKKIADRPSANWLNVGDVDWQDLDFHISQCKTQRNKDSFETALRVLTALKDQVLNRR